MLLPIQIQLCHRVAADAFPNSQTESKFIEAVQSDSRFAELDGELQATILERSKKLRSLWIANGVKEPIKQNFLDEIPDEVAEIINTGIDPVDPVDPVESSSSSSMSESSSTFSESSSS